MFEKIRLFYEKRLWTVSMVRTAADKGILSEAEYREIVGLQPDNGGEVSADG